MYTYNPSFINPAAQLQNYLSEQAKGSQMYTYNPSFINPAAQLQNYLSEQARETARGGFRQALGNPPSEESRRCGELLGIGLAQLILQLFDR